MKCTLSTAQDGFGLGLMVAETFRRTSLSVTNTFPSAIRGSNQGNSWDPIDVEGKDQIPQPASYAGRVLNGAPKSTKHSRQIFRLVCPDCHCS